MPKIRVLRILEYVYDNVEVMETDMSRWTMVSDPMWLGGHIKMRSVALPLEVVLDTPPQQRTQEEKIAFRKEWDARVDRGKA